jgi:hypothetical protein
MPDFVIRSFNGRRHHSIEWFPVSKGTGRGEYLGPELERIKVTAEVAALGLDRLIELHGIGADLRTVVVNTLEPAATLDGPARSLGDVTFKPRDPMEAMG